MTSFNCKKCGFRFESEFGKSCPYCGGKAVEKEKNAEELIENIEKLDL